MTIIEKMKTRKNGNVLLYWIPALLLLAPAAYVILLLESTVDNESFALKNKLRESYKSSLFDASRKLSDYWQLLEENKSLKSLDPVEIQTAIGVESLILYDTNGKMVFPIRVIEKSRESLPDSIKEAKKKVKDRDTINAINNLLFIGENSESTKEKGVALFEAATLLKQIGKPGEALEICNRLVFGDEFRNIIHYNGHLLYLDAIVLLTQLEPEDSSSTNQPLEVLVNKLNDYSIKELSTEQRYDLRKKLTESRPELYFPLQKPEGIALDFLKKTNNPDRRNVLQKTLLGDIWQYTVNGRIVLLFSADNLEQKMLSLIQFADIPDKTMIRLNPPGQLASDSIVHIDAANRMPGWRISLNFIDPGYMTSLINQRAKVYRVTSVLVISFSLVLGFLFLRDMRRRLHLADLKNDLVANVTHELKTPLASSRLLLDTLLTQPDLPKEKIESYLTHLSKENSRLCRLVEHFLAFSKLEKNQYNFQIKTISLDDLIDNLNEAIQGRFPTEKQRISYECTEEEVFLKGDIQSLVTVIVNLLENALKFSESDQKVFLKIVPVEENLQISVTDSGIGISVSDQKKVFEQYYQADNRLSRKYEGSGLGLSIVKTVLKAHGSEIEISSEPEKGSCFSFELKIENGNANETVDTDN